MSYPIDVNILVYASDAHLAAILQEHGVRTIYSTDTDFRKFSFLKVINPLRR